MSSHGLMETLTATAPATARSTNPTAIVRTSRMTRCFRRKEYRLSSPR